MVISAASQAWLSIPSFSPFRFWPRPCTRRTHLSRVYEEKLIRRVGIVGQMNQVVGGVWQREKSVGGHVHTIHITDILI